MSKCNLSGFNPVSYCRTSGKSYDVVLYTDGHNMMVARKGVAEQVGPVNSRHVLQNEEVVSLWYLDLSPVEYFRKERS